MNALLKNTMIIVSGTLMGITIPTLIPDSDSPTTDKTTTLTAEEATQDTQPKRFTKTRSNITNQSIATAKNNTTINKILTEPNISKRLIKLNEHIKTLNTDQIKEILTLNILSRDHSLQSLLKNGTVNNLLIQSWIETNPEEAIVFIRKNHVNSYFPLNQHIEKWFEKEPEKALNFFKKTEFPTYTDASLLISYYAKNNIAEGTEWLKNANIKYKEHLFSEFYSQAFKDLPLQEAAAKLKELSANEYQTTSTLRNLAGNWAKKDWTATKAWIDTLPQEQKETTLSYAISQIAQQDPAKAKELMPKNFSEREAHIYMDAIYSISSKEALKNPEAAMDWVTKQTEKIGPYNYPLESVMKTWASQSPEKAKEWLSKQPEGTNKELATLAYLSENKKLPSEEKLTLLSTITNKDHYQWRNEMGKALKVMNSQNKEAAETWLNNASFSDEIKNDLKNRMTPTKTIYDLKKDTPPS